ncbi:MAG: hypothetical protein COA58_08605 [Bacteroidetes bacterium]|nr:MAG: hypothetical protein COA58_08605 [Bacteroidota bacterium]
MFPFLLPIFERQLNLRLSYIIALLLCFCITEASHLIGGEITYTYQSGNKYQINVTLYRDCNDCKLGGQGGGSSTCNRSDLTKAFIRTTTSECQNKNIGSVNLTKTGFENITPICNQNNSQCGSNPTYTYGIEAHHYTGIIDFNTYSQYQGCGLHIFIHKPERSNDINTLASEEDDLYNFAYINPWIENVSSPVFKEHPNVLFNVNQAVYSGDHATKSNGDSIVYKWSSPEKSHNTAIAYNSSYSAQQFISTYCPSGAGCASNPNSNPPQGLYLNPQTGDYVFTPVTLNQTSTRVIEIEQWRKSNGTTYLAGIIRRDLLVKVINQNLNLAPILQTNSTYNLCVGQQFTLDIAALDLNSSGAVSGDSVYFETAINLSGVSITKQTQTTAPFNYVHLQITPTTNQVGTYTLRIKAKDNHCPKYAESIKTIILTILPKPEITFSIDDLFCGNNEITINSNRNATYSLEVKNEQGNPIFESANISPGYIYSNNQAQKLTYTLRYQDNIGCIDSLSTDILNTGTLGVTRSRLQGKTNYCQGNSMMNFLSHNTHSISEITWHLPNETSREIDTLRAEVQTGQLSYTYTLKKNNHLCELSDSSYISVIKTQTITFPNNPSYCYTNNLDINELGATPSNGEWYWDNTPILSQLDISKRIPNKDTFIHLTYSLIESSTLCRATKDLKITILEKPELVLSNLQICGDGELFKLKNSIDRPFDFSNENITWTILNKPLSYKEIPEPIIDIPNFGAGIYLVRAKNENTNGCNTIDTATITVDEDLVLTINSRNSICQSNESIDLNTYFDINIEGGAWQDDKSLFFTSNHDYIPKECGPNTFKYIYDRDGCYDDIEANVLIVCKPNFSISMDESICKDHDKISLSTSHNWSGQGVLNNLLDPSKLSIGENTIIAESTTEGCLFDTSISIDIVQPLLFSLGTYPDAICEGENIDIALIRKDHVGLTAQFCDSKFDYSLGEHIDYRPTNCDLIQEKINLLISSKSSKYCPSHSKSITIDYHPKPKVSLSNLQDGCYPYNLNTTLNVIQGSNPKISYTLSSSMTSKLGVGSILKFNNLNEGLYSISIKMNDDNGCSSIQNFERAFTVQPKPKASFTMSNNDIMVLSERELALHNYSSLNSGNLRSEWYHQKGSSSILFSKQNNPVYNMPADTGYFNIILIVKSDYNCSDTTTKSILLVPDIIAFIPNAFTPDNNPPNNKFNIISAHAQTFEISIFNKWGQKVFNSKDIQRSWDGTYQGQYCQNGVYLYSIRLTNRSGELYNYQGTVNLIR